LQGISYQNWLLAYIDTLVVHAKRTHNNLVLHVKKDKTPPATSSQEPERLECSTFPQLQYILFKIVSCTRNLRRNYGNLIFNNVGNICEDLLTTLRYQLYIIYLWGHASLLHAQDDLLLEKRCRYGTYIPSGGVLYVLCMVHSTLNEVLCVPIVLTLVL